MPFLTCHGVDIHWQQSGDGSPVVLVHGFGESCKRLWEQSFEGASFVDALIAGGHRAVRFDLRGHGRSTLSRDQSDYVIEKLVDDVAAVVREADADDAHFVGFSLGAELAFRYLLRDGVHARSAAFIGMGKPVLRPRRRATALAVGALTTDDPSDLHPALLKLRRIHTEHGNDLVAIATLLRAEIERVALLPEQLCELTLPTLFISGEREQAMGDAQPIADLVSGSRVVRIPGADHDTTPRTAKARNAVLAFFSEHE